MKNIFYAIFGLSLLLISCQKEEASAPADPYRSIYLRAQVENTIATRAPYLLSEPDQTNPLKVAVWASTTSGVFKDSGETGTDNVVALHTTANFTNGKEQLLNDAVYPSTGTTVHFVGLHPESGWTTPTEGETAGTTASITFKGCEDVMFAPQISGTYGEGMWPTFKFRHLLTWLRVSVKAENEDVSAAWGRIKSLRIESENSVKVNLSKEIDDPECFEFSGVTELDSGVPELDFYKTGSDNVFVDINDPKTWYTLPVDKEVEVAYVLCASKTATKQDPEPEVTGAVERTTEYTLSIETEARTVKVPVDLKTGASEYFDESTRNRQFLLNLTFKMGNYIMVNANITDWQMGGTGSGSIDPNDTGTTDATNVPGTTDAHSGTNNI